MKNTFLIALAIVAAVGMTVLALGVYKFNFTESDTHTSTGERIDEYAKRVSATKERCLLNDGLWLDEYAECERVSQEACLELGGLFNECASACRHNPTAEFCTMQCVQVCTFT